MSWYPLFVFLHVSSAVAVFAIWGMEAVGLQRLGRSVTAAEARSSAQQMRRHTRLAPAAMSTILVTGITLGMQWGHAPWMAGALAAVLGLAFVGGGMARRAQPRLEAALEDDSNRSSHDLASAVRLLRASLQLRVAVGVGIIGLMTMKPGMGGTLAILGVASVAGVVLAARETGLQWARSGSRDPLESAR